MWKLWGGRRLPCFLPHSFMYILNPTGFVLWDFPLLLHTLLENGHTLIPSKWHLGCRMMVKQLKQLFMFFKRNLWDSKISMDIYKTKWKHKWQKGEEALCLSTVYYVTKNKKLWDEVASLQIADCIINESWYIYILAGVGMGERDEWASTYKHRFYFFFHLS